VVEHGSITSLDNLAQVRSVAEAGKTEANMHLMRYRLVSGARVRLGPIWGPCHFIQWL